MIGIDIRASVTTALSQYDITKCLHTYIREFSWPRCQGSNLELNFCYLAPGAMCNLKGCETGKTGLDSSITRKRVGHSTKIVLSFAPDPVRYCPLASAPTIPFQGFQLVPRLIILLASLNPSSPRLSLHHTCFCWLLSVR